MRSLHVEEVCFPSMAFLNHKTTSCSRAPRAPARCFQFTSYRVAYENRRTSMYYRNPQNMSEERCHMSQPRLFARSGFIFISS